MKITEIGKWYYLLNKRLLKRIEFVLMLAVLPLLVFGVGIGAKQDKGVLHIILLTENKPDEEAREVIEKLDSKESILRFLVTDDEFLAKQMLAKQEADAIWGIPNGLREKIEKYVTNKTAFITIYQTQDSTLLNLSREILYRAIYPYIAFLQYRDFMKEHIQEVYTDIPWSDQQEDELKDYYGKVEANSDFLEFQTLNNGKEVQNEQKVDYLLSPIRGMLAIWLFVVIMVGNIYFLSDEKKGLFDFVDRKKRIVLGIVYKMSIFVNVWLLMMFTLWLTGQTGSIQNELKASLCLFAALLLFGEIILTIFPSIYLIGSLLFPISVLMLIGSPTFLDLRFVGISALSKLNPIYYYLKMVFDISYRKEFLLYILCSVLGLILLKMPKYLDK